MNWLDNLLAAALPFMPESFVRIFSKDYIAGDRLADALEAVRRLNQRKISGTIDLLGEDPKKETDCAQAVEIYKKAVDAIASEPLSSGISLKLSHLGFKLDRSLGFENIKTLVSYAGLKSVFVRIDMEDASLKQDTFESYLELKAEHDNVGVALQAYMRDALNDANRMVGCGANIRLCKGAYSQEDDRIVFKDMAVINASYVYLLEKLLLSNCFTAIATHDEKLVYEAMKLIDKFNIPKDRYEFQMLYGVAHPLRSFIAGQGHPVRVYVPFGKEWFAYCVRRLKENPKIAGYVFFNALKRSAKQRS